VAAFQALDAAITAKDTKAVERSLPPAWAMMKQAELEVPFATLFDQQLAGLTLSGEAAAVARQVLLLSPDYEKLTQGLTASDAQGSFLLALARGQMVGATPPDDLTHAVFTAFTQPEIPADLQSLMDQGRTGEVILQAMLLLRQGEAGDLHAVTEGLSVLHKMGMQDVARRTGLQLILLDRRG
jgi:hypothetical protein